LGKILDFKPKYVPKVFAIKPDFSMDGAFSWAIINTDADIFNGVMNKPIIDRCGVIKPFSSAFCLRTMNELCQSSVEIWRQVVGESREPNAIIVERPVNYSEIGPRTTAIDKLNIFVGMLLMSLSPKYQYSPSPFEWKGRQKDEDTHSQIMKMLSFNDINALERHLQNIKILQKYHVFNAIGLGIYGARVFNKENPPPEMVHFDKDSQFFESIAASVS